MCLLANRYCQAWIISTIVLPAVASSRAWGEERTAVDPGDLTGAIEAAIASAQPALGSARVGISVVETSTGRELFVRDGDGGYNVASNVKLVTATAALSLLGPGFRFQTDVLAAQPKNGKITGDVIIRGQGNPDFGLGAMEQLAHQVAAAGVTTITGGIVIDDSYFDNNPLPPHFAEQPEEMASFRAPIASTSVNSNRILVWVTPSESGHGPATVRIDPANDYVKLDHAVVTVERGQDQIRPVVESRGKNMIVRLEGQIGANSSWSTKLRIANPGRFFAAVLQRALGRHGIKVRRGYRGIGKAPRDAALITSHHSAPLAVVVRSLGKDSNNFVAEMLLKILGAEFVAQGQPATFEHGLTAVRQFAQTHLGFVAGKYYIGNGSGLFAASRLSPRDLVKTLLFAQRSARFGPELAASLAILGVDGTLGSRMRTASARGLVRGKTGTLDGVSALSGYARASGQSPLAFAVVINGFRPGTLGVAQRLQDNVAQALVNYQNRRGQSP